MMMSNAVAAEDFVSVADVVSSRRTSGAGLAVVGRDSYTHAQHGLIGNSDAMRSLLEQLLLVAATDSTVLVQGETGTGKELVARALHNMSPRSKSPFVVLNCAAIPASLLESELFGHERGAFTGAASMRLGRFEMANGGTLFLDEIGELPPDLQTRLLRVLQEREFERIGGTRTIHVDVRVVAATNRDLLAMTQTGGFRQDLYYRLSVFPVFVPALRDRPEDIPALATHFLGKHRSRMNKMVCTVAPETMAGMLAYDWPGNVRELQNFIERGVILSRGPVFDLHLPPQHRKREPAPAGRKTLHDAVREHILDALQQTNWVIGGPSGTAAFLGVPRTTLIARMQRLGIAPSASERRRASGGLDREFTSIASAADESASERT